MNLSLCRRLCVVAGVFLGMLLGVGCSDAVTQDDIVLGEIALSEAKALVEAHPKRVAGEDSEAVTEWIMSRLVGCSRIQCIGFDTPYGKMRNILVPSRPVVEGAKPVAVIASHFDTKAGIENFVGANDGAGTTGLLMAMARVSDLPVLYLFLDGEECRQSYSMTDGLCGAWFVAKHPSYHDSNWGFGSSLPVIVIDMLGDKDFTPSLASNGTPALNRLARRAAESVGLTLADAGPIVDDHVPFVTQGWRAIDIIDFRYGPENAWWHTSDDTVDKLSADSLAKTAALLRAMVDLLKEEQK